MDTTLTRIMQGIYKQGLYKMITETTGAGELSRDCHKSLSIKEGVSYFPFDCAMCKFITDLFFTNVGLVLTVYLRAKQIIHFRNDTEKKMFELLCSSRIALCLLHLSTCLTGCVYDLYWLNMVEAPLLNQIPCDSLICTASVDFICWNCAFNIVICLFLDLDSMSAQFFQTRL